MKSLELKFRLVIGIVCLILFISGVIWTTYKSNNEVKEFPTLSIDEQLVGVVEAVQRKRSWVLITFKDDVKRSIYSPSDLVDFISIGDLVEKSKNADTIYVARDNVTHKFILTTH